MTNPSTKARRRAWAALAVVGAAWALAASPAVARESRQQWQQPERVVEDLNLRPGAKVADIGAGRGFFTYRLARAVGEKGRVYATEISERAIRAVADRVKAEKIKNIEVVISEATDTKLDSNSLDAAVICLVLHHVPEKLRGPLTKDICRALRPGGYLYILDWRVDAKIQHDKNRRIPRADLVRLGTDAGMALDAEFFYLKHQVFLRLRKPAPKK